MYIHSVPNLGFETQTQIYYERHGEQIFKIHNPAKACVSPSCNGVWLILTTHIKIVSHSGHFEPRASIAAQELSTHRDHALAPCPRLWGQKIRNSRRILTFFKIRGALWFRWWRRKRRCGGGSDKGTELRLRDEECGVWGREGGGFNVTGLLSRARMAVEQGANPCAMAQGWPCTLLFHHHVPLLLGDWFYTGVGMHRSFSNAYSILFLFIFLWLLLFVMFWIYSSGFNWGFYYDHLCHSQAKDTT